MDTQWTEAITADFDAWRQTHTLEELEGIDWSQESETDRRQSEEETRL